jgi:hypothetical protein
MKVSNGWNANITAVDAAADHLLEEFSEELIIEAVNKKYEAEMWNRYWNTHRSKHVEEDVQKCYENAIPEVHLTLLEWKDDTLAMLAHLFADAKVGKRCTQYCGKLKVLIQKQKDTKE